MTKRVFDIVFSVAALVLLSPILLLAALLIKLDSAGPVFFRQVRVGRDFRPFLIFKFRSMVKGAQELGEMITFGDDPRITKVGYVLRSTKIDELPQFINVLRGDMSVAGPRPEVPRFVEMCRDDYEEILRVRPGITDLASLRYRHEAAELGRFEDPDKAYTTLILPQKIALAKQYLRRSSFWFDLGLIFRTALKMFEWGS